MSAARAAILGRIREALADVPPVSPAEDVEIDWRYGRPTELGDVLGRFAEVVEDYRATVVRVPQARVPDAIVDVLHDAGARSAVVPDGAHPSWRAAVEAAGIEVTGDDPVLATAQLDSVDAVVTGSAVGIAETGTIVLDHAVDQGRRALSLVPDVHVCVVLAGDVVSDVPEAIARLGDAVRAGQPLTWIAGPSATSDIELDRVEGVHGPRTLVVVLAD